MKLPETRQIKYETTKIWQLKYETSQIKYQTTQNVADKVQNVSDKVWNHLECGSQSIKSGI